MRSAAKVLKIPSFFRAALQTNPKARLAFDDFSPSHRREHVEWVTEARTEETRKLRLDQAIAWLAQGKPRNWKYMKKS